MKIINLAIRIIQQFKRDPRTLVLIFIVPIVVLWLFSIILSNGNKNVSIGFINHDDPIVQLKIDRIKDNLTFETVSIYNVTQEEAEIMLGENELDAYVKMDNDQLIIKLEGSDTSGNKEVITKVQEALKQLNPLMDIEIQYLYGTDSLDLFDTIGPIFLGFFAFFFIFILSGISFVRERLTMTLERVLISPIKRIEIVLGYVLGFGFFALIQSILITFFTVHFLDMYNVGRFVDVLIITCLIALSALTLGTFLSAFAHNEFQVMQFIPVVIVPQMFFTGLFPVDNLPLWFTILGKLFPLTYGADILRNIMFKGQSLYSNLFNISILFLFSIIFIFLNMIVLKKQGSR